MILRNILLCAIAVGVISGLAYGLFQQTQINPIIYGAEAYEVADVPLAHSHAETVEQGAAETAEAWAPEDGAPRIIATASANIAIAVAYALVMIALMALHNLKADKPALNARRGALWGIAALFAFFIAPALFGLHPEVPGTVAAELLNRQHWWMFCAATSAAGLAVLYYGSNTYKFIGALLLALPHVVGAPLPETHGFANTAPEAVTALTELTRQFYLMTSIGMALFFVLLGTLCGYAVQRFIRL
ncbi:MAG: CbtA family protein [Pseudomonadales bacterium]